MKHILYILLACLAMTHLSAEAQLNLKTGNQVAMRDFTLHGVDQQGQPWQLQGSKTKVQGSAVSIEDFTLLIQLKSKGEDTGFIKPDKEQHVKVRMTSDKCQFNAATNEIKSGDPIKVTIGKNITITGIGYDIDLNQKVILIRAAVAAHMTMPAKSKRDYRRNLK